MAIGPVQLIVLGFNHPNFHGEIIQELERLRESDTVRVIDALAVHKDVDGVEVSSDEQAGDVLADIPTTRRPRCCWLSMFASRRVARRTARRVAPPPTAAAGSSSRRVVLAT